jgi:hypothetical protein
LSAVTRPVETFDRATTGRGPNVFEFDTIYTDEPLPTGGSVLCRYESGRIVLLVHEPSLVDDPRGVLDEYARHRDTNMHAYLAGLRVAG